MSDIKINTTIKGGPAGHRDGHLHGSILGA